MILKVSDPIQSSIKYGLNIVVALLGIIESEERPSQYVLIFCSIIRISEIELIPTLILFSKSWVPVTESLEHITIDPDVKDILLSRFQDLGVLLKTEPIERLILASGTVIARVGTMRLAIVKFFAHLASLRKPEFMNEMVSAGILADIMV